MSGGGGGSSYDPQVGAAALKNSEISQQALDWTKDYYANTVSPLEQAANRRAEQTQQQQNALFERQIADYDQARGLYNNYGLPATKKYFDMVANYSSEGEQERQASAAMGDVVNAGAAQDMQLKQRFAALGIDPTSPAAVSAMSDAAVMNTAAQAAAGNKARNAARTLGIQLTSDAANFASGQPSQATQIGQSAGASSLASGATGQQAVQNALASGSFVQGGFKTALTGFGNSLSAYTSAANSERQTSAQVGMANSQGIGTAVGAVAGIAGAAILV